MKWGILTLAILAVLVGTANLFATEEWEKKWMDEGWVKINFDNNIFMKFSNTTWYGQVGKHKSLENSIYYIDPSGRKTFFKYKDFSGVRLGT